MAVATETMFSFLFVVTFFKIAHSQCIPQYDLGYFPGYPRPWGQPQFYPAPFIHRSPMDPGLFRNGFPSPQIQQPSFLTSRINIKPDPPLNNLSSPPPSSYNDPSMIINGQSGSNLFGLAPLLPSSTNLPQTPDDLGPSITDGLSGPNYYGSSPQSPYNGPQIIIDDRSRANYYRLPLPLSPPPEQSSRMLLRSNFQSSSINDGPSRLNYFGVTPPFSPTPRPISPLLLSKNFRPPIINGPPGPNYFRLTPPFSLPPRPPLPPLLRNNFGQPIADGPSGSNNYGIASPPSPPPEPSTQPLLRNNFGSTIMGAPYESLQYYRPIQPLLLSPYHFGPPIMSRPFGSRQYFAPVSSVSPPLPSLSPYIFDAPIIQGPYGALPPNTSPYYYKK